jgi:signal transduction histidine kinase
MPRASIRVRLTLTSVALVVGVTVSLLVVSWWLLGRHLRRTVPDVYADQVLAQLGSQYALAVGGSALVALGAGWLVAGHALAPIRAIAATARRITEDRLDARVRLTGPEDELHGLAATFDAMLDRLAGGVEAQRRFVANASHELRTPLTVMRTEAEVALDDPDATVEDLREVARAVVETTDRTEALLDGLLVLAVSTQGTRRDEPVDLTAVARRAIAASRRETGPAGVSLRLDLEPVAVRGDAALLERLVGNLVENAARHGRRDADAHIDLRVRGGEAVLSVRNGGARIPMEALEHLVEPFQRLQRGSAGGSGLGLSIVRAVAEAHGGALRLAAPAGGGLHATVRLPAAAVISR